MSKDTPEGDRIAKVLSRAGIASRREAERMIEAGRVSVNGKVIDSAALNVGPKDRIAVDGTPVGAPEPPRLWLYHKPAGLVTTEADEKGRETVFDALPEDLPRVMSVGRLDLNSEGLLLLTNDGEIKRRLELPSTGWLRRYRVRIHGSVSEDKLDQLRRGITVDGLAYQPMIVQFDRQQGANAWLTVAIREGKNREIRRAMEAIGVTVNRLIRLSYGPFQLGNLEPGGVEEVRRKVLRDQLGLDGGAEEAEAPRGRSRATPRRSAGKPGAPGRPANAGSGPRGAKAPSTAGKPAGDRPKSAMPGRTGAGAPRSGKPGGPSGAAPTSGRVFASKSARSEEGGAKDRTPATGAARPPRSGPGGGAPGDGRDRPSGAPRGGKPGGGRKPQKR